MKKIILSISLIIMCAWDTQPETKVEIQYGCNCAQKQKVANWVQASIADANNKSDEEMEDVIMQLERTAVRLICPQRQVKMIKYSNEYWRVNQIDSLSYYNY